MSDLLVTVCTKAKDIKEFESRPIFKSLQAHYDRDKLDFRLFTDNKSGLSKCYNEVIRDPNNIDKTVLFVHDDVELNDLFLSEKLLESPYTITGLAGAKSFNKQNEKLAWHLATTPEDMVGEVAHKYPNNVVCTTIFGRPGNTNSRALTLDGLFLSCHIKTLVEKELYFDEEFNFHFYDIAFCLKAHEKKVTCGVLPIHVVHHGLGNSMLTPEWEEANKKFKEVYCT
jgi:hypothetical protein